MPKYVWCLAHISFHNAFNGSAASDLKRIGFKIRARAS